MLYMATLSAERHDPVLRNSYRALLERGQTKKLAVVACMRKLLIILNANVRDSSWNLLNLLHQLDFQHNRCAGE